MHKIKQMGKSQVPRGSTRKEQCDCGRYYYPYQIGNSIIYKCELCHPRADGKKKWMVGIDTERL